jgi:hypothetical protein
MSNGSRIAALAAIAAIGLTSTAVPAAAWHCHGYYQGYSGNYSPQYQNYQNYSQGYYPRYSRNYSYQPAYPNEQDYSYNYPQQDYSQAYSEPSYPPEQYGDGQNYDDQNGDGPSGGS